MVNSIGTRYTKNSHNGRRDGCGGGLPFRVLQGRKWRRVVCKVADATQILPNKVSDSVCEHR